MTYRQTNPISFWWQKRHNSLRQGPLQEMEAGSEPFWTEAKQKGGCCPCFKSATEDFSPSVSSCISGSRFDPKRIADFCASRLNNLNNEKVVTTSRAPIERSLEDGSAEIAVRYLKKPYTTSYFFPGKLEGKSMQFLIDTGCTTNLLFAQVFNQLSEQMKGYLE